MNQATIEKLNKAANGNALAVGVVLSIIKDGAAASFVSATEENDNERARAIVEAYVIAEVKKYDAFATTLKTRKGAREELAAFVLTLLK